MKYSARLTKLIAKCGYKRTTGALMQKCIVYVRDCLVIIGMANDNDNRA